MQSDSLVCEFGFVIVFLAVCALIAYSLSSEPKKPERQNEWDNREEGNQQPQVTPAHGVAMDLIQPPRNHHPTEDERKERSDQREEEKLFYEKATFWGVAIYVVINLFILCAMLQSNRTSHEALVDVQRASMDLGLADGTLAYLTDNGTPDKEIAICFRNNGHVTAKNVVVELRIAIAPPPFLIDFPPVGWKPDLIHGFFVRSGETMSPEGLVGPDVGAGTPYIYRGTVSTEDFVKIQDGKHGVQIVGRISYQDGFGKFSCESFCAAKYGPKKGDFGLCVFPVALCDGEAHTAHFGQTMVPHNKWKNVIPGEMPSPSATWTPPPHDPAHTEQ